MENFLRTCRFRRYKTYMKLLYAGAGPVSHFHVPALRNAGFEIVSCFTREGSKNLEQFSKTLQIPKSPSMKSFEGQIGESDGIVVAVKTEASPEMIRALAAGEKPMLVEKPGALDSRTLLEIANEYRRTPIFVAYNRRFYDGFSLAREMAQEIHSVSVIWPEPGGTDKSFLTNGVHMVDILRYILGDLQVVSLRSLGADRGFACLLESTEWSLPVTVNAIYGTSSNAAISIFLKDGSLMRFEPFETLKSYQGFDVEEPNQRKQIRGYNPILKKTLIEDDSRFKPGFESQSLEFAQICSGESDIGSTTLPSIFDAVESLRLAEKMVGLNLY